MSGSQRANAPAAWLLMQVAHGSWPDPTAQDGLEETWAVNVATPFLLTACLIDLITWGRARWHAGVLEAMCCCR